MVSWSSTDTTQRPKNPQMRAPQALCVAIILCTWELNSTFHPTVQSAQVWRKPVSASHHFLGGGRQKEDRQKERTQ